MGAISLIPKDFYRNGSAQSSATFDAGLALIHDLVKNADFSAKKAAVQVFYWALCSRKKSKKFKGKLKKLCRSQAFFETY